MKTANAVAAIKVKLSGSDFFTFWDLPVDDRFGVPSGCASLVISVPFNSMGDFLQKDCKMS